MSKQCKIIDSLAGGQELAALSPKTQLLRPFGSQAAALRTALAHLPRLHPGNNPLRNFSVLAGLDIISIRMRVKVRFSDAATAMSGHLFCNISQYATGLRDNSSH